MEDISGESFRKLQLEMIGFSKGSLSSSDESFFSKIIGFAIDGFGFSAKDGRRFASGMTRFSGSGFMMEGSF